MYSTVVDQVACTTTCEQEGYGMYEEQKHPGTVAAFQSCAPTSERFSV